MVMGWLSGIINFCRRIFVHLLPFVTIEPSVERRINSLQRSDNGHYSGSHNVYVKHIRMFAIVYTQR